MSQYIYENYIFFLYVIIYSYIPEYYLRYTRVYRVYEISVFTIRLEANPIIYIKLYTMLYYLKLYYMIHISLINLI